MILSESFSISTSLSSYAKEINESLTQLTNKSFDNIVSYDIDCTLLSDFGKSIECEKTLKFITDLEQFIDIPAVYWFEIVSEHTTLEIYNSAISLKENSLRKLPAHKKLFSKWDSKVLYVGKVKSNISGRMYVHLGYHRAPTIQGLQLCHWVNIEGLKLRLNVIYLPKNLDMLAGTFEFHLAKQLHPILGKHR
ncbi:hypothetical protein [Pedobacter immunditicola]|uniref:hypothetical protein n=1 Tax=Pedobacter immunditicola TaxID=3133440 RepID=UPI0030B122FE